MRRQLDEISDNEEHQTMNFKLCDGSIVTQACCGSLLLACIGLQ